MLLLIVLVHSFSKMLPYVKFTEDKVLIVIFIILRKKMWNQCNVRNKWPRSWLEFVT